MKLKTLYKKILAAVILIIIYITLFICFSFVKTVTYNIDVKTINKENSFRIVQISDYHSNNYNESLINRIKICKPDLIVLTGDIFDYYVKKDQPIERVEFLLNGIKDICPFYYVTGNHEYYYYHRAEFTDLIEQYGGKVLNDSFDIAQIKNNKVLIAGIRDPNYDFNYKQKDHNANAGKVKKQKVDITQKYFERLKTLGKNVDEYYEQNGNTDISILLAHRPSFINEYLKYNYTLTLSGHAHGGMWQIPFIKKGIYYSDEGLFPKYAGGLFSFNNNNNYFVVSRGLCKDFPLIPRLFNNPELVVINVE